MSSGVSSGLVPLDDRCVVYGVVHGGLAQTTKLSSGVSSGAASPPTIDVSSEVSSGVALPWTIDVSFAALPAKSRLDDSLDDKIVVWRVVWHGFVPGRQMCRLGCRLWGGGLGDKIVVWSVVWRGLLLSSSRL